MTHRRHIQIITSPSRSFKRKSWIRSSCRLATPKARRPRTIGGSSSGSEVSAARVGATLNRMPDVLHWRDEQAAAIGLTVEFVMLAIHIRAVCKIDEIGKLEECCLANEVTVRGHAHLHKSSVKISLLDERHQTTYLGKHASWHNDRKGSH